MKTFMPSFKTEEGLKAHQLEGLQWTVNHAYNGSLFYRMKFAEAGVKPGDIKNFDDIGLLPFTTAGDLQGGYPFPLLSVPMEKVVRIHASSGTTGKRKVLSYTAKDVDDWANMLARCYEIAGMSESDRIQIGVGYGVWTAGIGFQLGAERFGALVIPSGPGNLDMQCEFLVDFQTTILCCTASMSLLMAEEVEKRGLREKISLKKVILGSERSSDAMRERIKTLLGVTEIYDIPGMTELYGPGAGLDCSFHTGIHYWADYYILELLNPKTMKPVSEGEIGEMVITTLRKEAAPLVRYRTRDLTRRIPGSCPCGSILPRHDRLLGRSDDMFIFRAVNVYPGQIDHVLSGVKGIGSEYQVHLNRKEDGKDYMTIKVERGENALPDQDEKYKKMIEASLKKQILASGEVHMVAYGALPRSERKTKRVFDNRD
jgi:phenylacetate-CoA ligase